jgi:hypothetical protein
LKLPRCPAIEATFTLSQKWHSGPAGVEHPVQIDARADLPLFVSHVMNHLVTVQTCGGDQKVQFAEAALDGLGHAVGIRRLDCILFQAERPFAGWIEGLGKSLNARLVQIGQYAISAQIKEDARYLARNCPVRPREPQSPSAEVVHAIPPQLSEGRARREPTAEFRCFSY